MKSKRPQGSRLLRFILEKGINMIITSDIESFIKDAHKGQKYGGKDYFTYHLKPVAIKSRNLANKFNVLIFVAYNIGLAHDLYEDRSIWWKDFKELLLTNYGSAQADVIENTVLELTKDDEETYYTYIHRLNSIYALIVKYADLTINIDESQKNNFKKLDTYLFAKDIIEGKLRKHLILN